MRALQIAALCAALAACAPPTRTSHAPAGPVVITPISAPGGGRAVRITGSSPELTKLKARYTGFKLEFGGAKGAIRPDTKQGYADTLNLPWIVLIPAQLPRPSMVKLVGMKKDGEVELIAEANCP